MTLPQPSIESLHEELARAREPWPVIHEHTPAELGRHAGARRDHLQYSMKIHDWLTFVCSGESPRSANDAFILPMQRASPVQAADRLRAAVQWFIDSQNFQEVISALERWIAERKGSQWLVSYFVHSTFPAIYNHFSTGPAAMSASSFIHRVLEVGRVLSLSAVDLTCSCLRAAFSFRQRIVDRLFILAHKKGGPNIEAFLVAVCDSIDWLPSVHQELLRFLHSQRPAETNRMLVQSFFVEIVNLMRLSPEFIANDAFASYTFLEDARFALAFPIHKALMAMNDRRATQFLAPFWEKLESPGLPSGQFAAVTVILGAEADSFYFSELDLAILTSLYGRPISDRPIEVKFESSYRLFELPVPSPTTSPPKDDPPDEEFRRGQLHRTFDLGDVDPFECLPDSPESRALIDREILWYRTSLASLRARLKTYAQLDADAVTVDSLVNCLYFLYVERFPILPGTSNRLQGAVREIRRAFKARALGLAGLDLVGLASASQLRDLAREFSDDIPADRETFVKNLAAKVSAIGKIPSTPLFQRYNRLRETYAEFEAVAFLQTLSGLRVEIDELPGMKGRFGASAPTPPPAEFRVARQMLADCLARRKVASDQGNGARRLRGHEAVAAAEISAQLSGGGDGPRALHLIVDSFEVPQREEIGVFFQEVLAVRTKCGARFGVDFDPEFVANLDALVQWMNAITNV